MPPTGWPTDDQKDWLEDRNDAAIEARRTGAYSKWITATLHDWFLLWSEKTRLFGTFTGKLTPEQEAELGKATRHKQEQIRNWFHNNRHKRFLPRAQRVPNAPTHVVAAPSRGPAGPSRQAIRSDLATGKASRAPQAREVYCRMYYDEDKQAVVNQQLTAEREVLGRTLTKSETMAISRRLIDGFFDEEPEDVKEEIQTRVDEVKAARKAPPPPDDPNRKRTPEEYQNAIDAAPRIITKLLTPVHEDSGWCFSVVGAGPSPRHGGAIKSFAVHFGTNPSGHMLDEAIADYRVKYLHPMVHFAKGVYPRDVRDERALPASIYQDAADDMMMLVPRPSGFGASTEGVRASGPSGSSTTVTRASSVSAPVPSQAATSVSAVSAPERASSVSAVRPPEPVVPQQLTDGAQAMSTTAQAQGSTNFDFPVAEQFRFSGAPALPRPWDAPIGEYGNGDGNNDNLYDMDGDAGDMGGWPAFSNATYAVPIPPISYDPLLPTPIPPLPAPAFIPVAPPPAPGAAPVVATPVVVAPVVAAPVVAALIVPPPAPALRRSNRHQDTTEASAPVAPPPPPVAPPKKAVAPPPPPIARPPAPVAPPPPLIAQPKKAQAKPTPKVGRKNAGATPGPPPAPVMSPVATAPPAPVAPPKKAKGKPTSKAAAVPAHVATTSTRAGREVRAPLKRDASPQRSRAGREVRAPAKPDASPQRAGSKRAAKETSTASVKRARRG